MYLKRDILTAADRIRNTHGSLGKNALFDVMDVSGTL